MKQLRKYWIGMLLLTTLFFVTACGSKDSGNAADNGNSGTGSVTDEGTAGETGSGAGTGLSVDDVLFDTDGDGAYDHTDVDGDGLLEEIGNDANDVVDDLVNDVTGEGDTMLEGTGEAVENDGIVEKEKGTAAP